MPRGRVRGDRCEAAAAPRHGSREDRHGGDRQDVVQLGLLIRQRGEEEAERLDRGQMVCRREKRPQQAESAAAAAAERQRDLPRVHGRGRYLGPEQAQHLLEAQAGEILQVVTADDQTARRTIDIAERSFGGDDVVEPDGRGAKAQCRGMRDWQATRHGDPPERIASAWRWI
jgi:hypothetical protein